MDFLRNIDEIFTPVAKPATFRGLLAIASYKNMKVRQVDIKTEFLYGDIGKEIYMKQPKGYIISKKEHFVCKLNHSLYDLKQSARCWNLRINKVIIDSGFRKGEAEACLYVRGSGVSITYVLIYIDDILIASNDDMEINDVIKIEEQQNVNFFLLLIQLLEEFQINICDPIIFEDNQSCLKMLQEDKITP